MENCTEISNNKIIVLKEKRERRKAVFNNPNRKDVEKILVDNCLIKVGKKCDFLVKRDDGYEYFVELKGQDVEYACLQLEATVNALSENVKNAPKHCVVVCSKNPLTGTENQILKKRFKKTYKAKLIIKSKVWTTTI